MQGLSGPVLKKRPYLLYGHIPYLGEDGVLVGESEGGEGGSGGLLLR